MTVTILALDSASSVCGVSILQTRDTETTVSSAEHIGSSQHAEHMLPLIENTLVAAQCGRDEISAVAFAQGPGGFTGLRVACGVAQGIAYALGVPVAPVSSLLAIAAQQMPLDSEANVIELVVVDARMQELYLGAYQRTAAGWYSLHKPVLISVNQLYEYVIKLQSQQQQLGVEVVIRASGDALLVFEGLSTRLVEQGLVLGNTELAQSTTIAQLGLLAYEQQQLLDPALASPLYVRNRVAFTITEREAGLGGNPAAHWQSVTIRAMELTDIEAVAALESELQLQPWTTEQFISSIEAGHWAWVATFEQKIVAYAVLRPIVDECELLLIGVAVDHQRQGIAQQLLCYAEQHARAQGSTMVHLEVRVSNAVARDLYQGAGYDQVGLRKDYYLLADQQREHAALYTKTLA